MLDISIGSSSYTIVAVRFKRAVPTGDMALLNSYGGVTATLKRAVERQPAAEVRSFQVVIDGERIRQSHGPMEARFGSASRGSRARSGM